MHDTLPHQTDLFARYLAGRVGPDFTYDAAHGLLDVSKRSYCGKKRLQLLPCPDLMAWNSRRRAFGQATQHCSRAYFDQFIGTMFYDSVHGAGPLNTAYHLEFEVGANLF